MTEYDVNNIADRVINAIPNLSSTITGGILVSYGDIVAADIGVKINKTISTGGFGVNFVPAMYWGMLTMAYMYEMGVEPTDDISQITIDVITITKNKDRNYTSYTNAQQMYKSSIDSLNMIEGGSRLFIGNTNRRRSLK